jgi:bile acid:Na+ symporter, BASS family
MEHVKSLVVSLLIGSICLTSFALGLKATYRDVLFVLRRPALLARSVLAMNVLTPLVAVLVLRTLTLQPVVNVAIVAFMLAPVPPMLPGTQLKMGGRSPYVYGALVSSALLSIVLVPLTLEILGRALGQDLHISPFDVARSVTITVLLPVTCGIAVRHWLAPFAQRVAPSVARVANIALLVLVVPLLIAVLPAALKLVGNGTVLAILAIVVAGLGIGHVLGGPDPEDRTSLALACASRHPGVALAIVHANYANLKVGAALVLFLLVAAVATLPYKRWRERHGIRATAPVSR